MTPTNDCEARGKVIGFPGRATHWLPSDIFFGSFAIQENSSEKGDAIACQRDAKKMQADPVVVKTLRRMKMKSKLFFLGLVFILAISLLGVSSTKQASPTNVVTKTIG